MDNAHKPRVLIIGHSFVHRMKSSLRKPGRPTGIHIDFQLKESCEVILSGVGGHTIGKLLRFDLHKITTLSPHIVILEIGSNDLCDSQVNTTSLGEEIVAFVKRLYQDFNAKFIVVCQVLKRLKPPFTSYNHLVAELNAYLSQSLDGIVYAKFWRHKGLSFPSTNIYARHGIHLNDLGNKALYRSYRGACLYALSCLPRNIQNATKT